MIHTIHAKDVKPGMKLHIAGKVTTVHAPPYFWPGDQQGRGFIAVREDDLKQAVIVTIYRQEKLAVE